jgi:hypothetical protein
MSLRWRSGKLAAESHYRLSTKSRQKLLGILQKTAATLPLVKVFQPTDDPKYIDKVIDEVVFQHLRGDTYYLKWKGGRTTVYRPDVDTTGKSKALPLLQIYDSKISALVAAGEQSDIARSMGYDTVVAYYRGAADVILPTWISPETAPVTYDLMRGVSDQATQTAAAAYEFSHGLRNGMIFGAALWGGFRLLGRARALGGVGFGGGPSTRVGTPPVAAKVESAPTPKPEPAAPTTEPAPAPGPIPAVAPPRAMVPGGKSILADSYSGGYHGTDIPPDTAVTAAPGPAGIRVWKLMSGGWELRRGDRAARGG